MIVFRKRPATKAMPIHSAAARTRGMRCEISLSIVGRRAGDRLDPEDLERGDRDRDDDQREDEYAGSRVGEAGAASRPARAPGGTASGDGADGAVRSTPIPMPGEQAVDIGRDQHRLDQSADDPRDDQADEEDQPRAEQPRQEGEDLGHQLIDRREDLADAEEAAARP